MVPEIRVRPLNDRPVRRDGAWVLYWMTAARRLRSNAALERAVGLARDLRRPLVVLEPLACDYPWASDRLHRFVLDGMRDQRDALRDTPVRYHPYVEPAPRGGRGLLDALAADACAVIADDAPVFFLPRIVRAAGARLPVAAEAVDANGLLPLRAADRGYPTAHAFRRFLQRALPDELTRLPAEDPLRDADLPPAPDLPAEVRERWPAAADALLDGDPGALAALPIDHAVRPVPRRGGAVAGTARLRAFVADGLDRYADARHPDAHATSGLSPYLHFGHVAAHDAFAAVAAHEGWTLDRLAPESRGARAGWWGMSPAAEAFIDELVTWRELALNAALHGPDPARFESLPDWARRTLADHAADPREHLYAIDDLDDAATDDPVWNAAQRELRETGVIHGYLRMLWGKKILEWSDSPERAFEVMVELNNRYAIDGRDPNSFAGIQWVLGRFDRAWGPERPVIGKVRAMTSAQAVRKLRMREYLERFGA